MIQIKNQKLLLATNQLFWVLIDANHGIFPPSQRQNFPTSLPTLFVGIQAYLFLAQRGIVKVIYRVGKKGKMTIMASTSHGIFHSLPTLEISYSTINIVFLGFGPNLFGPKGKLQVKNWCRDGRYIGMVFGSHTILPSLPTQETSLGIADTILLGNLYLNIYSLVFCDYKYYRKSIIRYTCDVFFK